LQISNFSFWSKYPNKSFNAENYLIIFRIETFIWPFLPIFFEST
jgi:hypothetical protein